jgi:tetratricopeptide (TPR) repeat protein
MKAHFEIAQLYYSKKDYKMSLLEFEKCIENNYEKNESYFYAGCTLYHKQKYNESMELLSKCQIE